MKTPVGSLPGGSCNVTSIVESGTNPVTSYDKDPVSEIAPDGRELSAIGVFETSVRVVPLGEVTDMVPGTEPSDTCWEKSEN